MYDSKHLPSQWNDDFHSHPDSAFLLTDVPDVSGKGVDEDHVLWNYEAHYDQADKVQLELMLPEIRASNTIEACLQTEYVEYIMPSYVN